MEPLFKALPEIIKALGPNSETDEALALAAWSRCAGPLLASRTRATQFFENRLMVAVEDETWRRHLEDLSPRMIAQLNDRLGEGSVRFIEFRVNARAIKHATARSVNDTPACDLDPSVTTASNAISDEQLRDSFLNAAAAYLVNRK